MSTGTVIVVLLVVLGPVFSLGYLIGAVLTATRMEDKP